MEQKPSSLTLVERVLVSVIVTQHHRPIEERPDHRWEYFEYVPPGKFKGKRWAQLISHKELPLYVGEFAVARGVKEETTNAGLKFLHIDGVVGEKRFVVKEGDIVSAADAAITRTPNTTYFNWIRLNFSGWNVNIKVPLLALGERLPVFSIGNVKVTKIVTPRDERSYYMLYGELTTMEPTGVHAHRRDGR